MKLDVKINGEYRIISKIDEVGERYYLLYKSNYFFFKCWQYVLTTEGGKYVHRYWSTQEEAINYLKNRMQKYVDEFEKLKNDYILHGTKKVN